MDKILIYIFQQKNSKNNVISHINVNSCYLLNETNQKFVIITVIEL